MGAAETVVREYTVDALTIRLPADAADRLARADGIRYVERDGWVQSLGQTTPYGVARIGADETRLEGITGDGVDVAVLDTGIEPNHEDLERNVGDGLAVVGCQSGCSIAWDDDNGHGTHCAGTIAARDNNVGVVGVAPNATVHSVKVLDSAGAGTYSDVAAGLDYVIQQGYDVASMAFGGQGSSSLVVNLCQDAYNAGVLLVAAAGSYSSVAFPASRQSVIAVTAVDRNDQLLSGSATGSSVELTAPGEQIRSTYLNDTYTQLTGTSLGCSHVAGVGALLMSQGRSNVDARRTMRATAKDLGLPSDQQGAGLVCAADAFGL